MAIYEQPGRLQWHHKAHTEWADSSLSFWFFRFRQGYDPDEVLPALHEAAEEIGLRAFASYELLGPCDVMARIYIPAGSEAALDKAVWERLHRYQLDVIETFRVANIARHWPWARSDGAVGAGNGSRKIKDPRVGVLRRRRSSQEIATINEIGELAESLETVALDPQKMDLLLGYMEEDLVVFSTRSQGIKLVIRISAAENPTPKALQDVKRLLCRVLDEAPPLVEECSLYVGEPGQQILMLLMCRVDFANFHKIRRKLLQEVHEIVGSANSRTMTFVVVSDDVVCFTDGLPENVAGDGSTTGNSSLSASG
jgi:hypothetical protein